MSVEAYRNRTPLLSVPLPELNRFLNGGLA